MLFRVALFFAFIGVFVSSSDVLELTDDDFSTRIKEHEYVLIMFYAPWCGHCKNLKPEFDKASSLLVTNDPPVALAKVDCTERGRDTCKKFSVSGYPSLQIFKNGQLSREYNGPREAAGIVKYMRGQVRPSVKDLPTKDALEKFVGESELAVVGFFEESSHLKNTFVKVADKLREKFRFGISLDAETSGSYKEQVVLFRPKHLHNKFEPSTAIFNADSSKDMESFINSNAHGLVGHRTKDNAQQFINPLILVYYNLDYIKNPKGTNYWRNRILKVAKNFADDFHFAVSCKDDFRDELNKFGYDSVPTEKPIVFALDKDNIRYAMTGSFSVEKFEAFLKRLKSGSLEPYVKSEPIPKNNDKPVKVAVAKNFDEVVTNNFKDTLIEFYASGCRHHQKLTPVYDELAEKLANEDVAIAKMDASKNDIPSYYEVRGGFPTIYWVPKNYKMSPIPYNGGRKLDDFIKYIAKQATSELKGYDRSGNVKSKDEL